MNENADKKPKLSLERAEEILRNVYRAAGIEPPGNCREILEQARFSDIKACERQ